MVELTEGGEFLFGWEEFPSAAEELEEPLSDEETRALFGEVAPVLEAYEDGLSSCQPLTLGLRLAELLDDAIIADWLVIGGGPISWGGATVYAQDKAVHHRFEELKTRLQAGFDELNKRFVDDDGSEPDLP